MKTYSFKVVLEKDKWPDDPDEKAVWRAYIPALEHKGAASWGYTEKEALENLKNAVELLVEHLLERRRQPQASQNFEIIFFNRADSCLDYTTTGH